VADIQTDRGTVTKEYKLSLYPCERERSGVSGLSGSSRRNTAAGMMSEEELLAYEMRGVINSLNDDLSVRRVTLPDHLRTGETITWGAEKKTNTAMIALAMIGCDVDFCTKNADDIPENTFMSERAVSVVEKLSTLMYDPLITYSWSRAGVGEQPAFAMYQSDKSLFYYGELHAVATMRDMESDFGIMPMPKFDESQSGYHHCVNPNVCATIVIPKDNMQYEMTGYVMDALGAASKNLLTPAYYDVNLKGKYFRDEESAEMLDLIFETRFFDVGMYYQLGGYNEKVITMMQQNDTDFASMYAKNEKVANKILQKINDAYAAMP
jgi:hypothetical protein